MTPIGWLSRNATGPRSRRADALIRGTGAILLAGALATAIVDKQAEDVLGAASPLILALALATVLLLWSGLFLLVGGRELFLPQPAPPRSWMPERRRYRS